MYVAPSAVSGPASSAPGTPPSGPEPVWVHLCWITRMDSAARQTVPGEIMRPRDGKARDYSFTLSTVFLTDWKLFSISAFSASLSAISWIFSTPWPPMVTGTPKK
jgi:hypothetical protein